VKVTREKVATIRITEMKEEQQEGLVVSVKGEARVEDFAGI
jgi:hypothetical protein